MAGLTEAGLYLATLFEAAHADSLIEVRCPKRGRLQQFFPVSAIDAVTLYVTGWARATDVYIGVAPRIRTKGKQTGGKDAIAQLAGRLPQGARSNSLIRVAHSGLHF